ncbi:MAG: YDG domain-containing protein [Kiritimatiellaeota bacterium]|nr:YDG domain-containing protein [Kiritimatiellota bacterium]
MPALAAAMLLLGALPASAYTYYVDKNLAGQYVVMRESVGQVYVGSSIQSAINSIRDNASQSSTTIIFNDMPVGTPAPEYLDIGANGISFNNDAPLTYNWCANLTLQGSITSSYNGSGSMIAVGCASTTINNGAKIRNTGGSVIFCWGSALTITGGSKVTATGASSVAIFPPNEGDFTLTISGAGTEVTSAYRTIEIGSRSAYAGTHNLNINGGTVSSTGTSSRTIDVVGPSTIRLGVGLSSAALVTSSGSSAYTIYNYDASSDVRILGGTVSATGSSGTAIYNRAGTVTIGDPDFLISFPSVTSPYRAIHNASASSSAVTVLKGSVEGTGNNGQAIYNAGSGTVRVEGGEVTSANTNTFGATIRNNTNGVIRVEGGTVRNTYTGSSARVIYNLTNGTVRAYGGTIEVTSGAGIHSYDGNVYLGGTPTITGSAGGVSILTSAGRLFASSPLDLFTPTFAPGSNTYSVYVTAPVRGAVVSSNATIVNNASCFTSANNGFTMGTLNNNLILRQDITSASIVGGSGAAYGDAALTASVSPSGASVTCSWWRGSAIVGSGASYTIAGLDVGNFIRLTVTGTGEWAGTVYAFTDTVLGKALTWNNGTVYGKVYDGTTAVTVNTQPTLSGIINGDTVTPTIGTAAFLSKNAGAQWAVASGYGIGGAHAGYYRIGAQPGLGQGTITPRPITVTADYGQWKEAGDADPDLTFSVTSGTLASGDAFEGALTRQDAGGNTLGANFQILQGNLKVGLDGNNGNNYQMTFTPGSTFSVLAASVPAITSIRFVNNNTEVEIVATGCTNPNATYCAIGDATHVDFFRDPLMRNTVPGSTGKNGINDGVGLLTFTFPKPSANTYFFLVTK